jgi:DNA-nicking Smr family endonuclease
MFDFFIRNPLSLFNMTTFSFYNLGSEIDLHHFHPKDTALIVNGFIQYAVQKGLKEIRIIHGKGRSVKKREVLKLLKDHPLVEDYRDSPGNWGATLVCLKD